MTLGVRSLASAALVLTLSGASSLFAATAGPVSGRALDAGGRPLAGVRIELVQAIQSRPVGVPALVQRTDAQGAWSFRAVPAGEYVVRMSHHERTTGVPVSVADGTGAPGVVIVAPSLPPSERPEQAQGVAGAAVAAGGASTAAMVANVLVVTAIAAAVTNINVVVTRDES